MNTSTVEKQIESYLPLLSPSQKETVLSVMKTIVKAQQEYENIWDDKLFAKEMDKRTESYENGTAKLLNFEDMKKAAILNFSKKRTHKNDL